MDFESLFQNQIIRVQFKIKIENVIVTKSLTHSDHRSYFFFFFLFFFPFLPFLFFLLAYKHRIHERILIFRHKTRTKGSNTILQQSQYLIMVLDDLQSIGGKLKDLSDKLKEERNKLRKREIYQMIQYYQVVRVKFDIFDFLSEREWKNFVSDFKTRMKNFEPSPRESQQKMIKTFGHFNFKKYVFLKF